MGKPWPNHYPEHIRREIEVPDLSLPEMLTEAIHRYGDQSAIYFYGEEITYNQLGEMVQSFAASLQEQGLEKGDRVALMLPNCPPYIISYYGILLAGGMVAQVNPLLVDKELAHILIDSGSKTIVIYEPLLPVLHAIIDQTEIEHVIVVRLGENEAKHDQAVDFETFLKKATPLIQSLLIAWKIRRFYSTQVERLDVLKGQC